MITLPTSTQAKALDPRHVAQDQDRLWREAWGLVLVAMGLFLAMACYSFHPADYEGSGLRIAGVTNWGGPVGAHAAAQVLGRFGVIGLVWPVTLMVWGVLTIKGVVMVPRGPKFLGLLVLSMDLTGFCEILLPIMGVREPAFGYGGVIGHFLAHSLKSRLGMAGALIGLGLFGILALLFTDYVRLGRLYDQVVGLRHQLRYHLHRFARRQGRASLQALKGALARLWASPLWRRRLGLSIREDAPKVAKSTEEPQSLAPSLRADLPVTRVAKVIKEVATVPSGSFALELTYDGPAHGRPDANDFARSRKAPDRSHDLSAGAAHLVAQLAEFRIMGEICAVTQGPLVTTYEFKPAPGTKVSKISSLGEDLARLLKASSLRVLAPIPGKDTVGFEVPSPERATIGFADLIGSPAFADRHLQLPIAMGVDIFGVPVVEDLAGMPHLLVAGSTGSGKSVFMNSLIGSLIARHTAETLRLVMIDPKMVELSAYNGLPHMACPVITDPQVEARTVLGQLVVEMDLRYHRMKLLGARNIETFNQTIASRKKHDFVDYDGPWTKLPYIVLIIDEMADLMMQLGRDAELPIARLAQKARAAGIHMVIATQRPTTDVVTGLIKANFPTRVAFRVMSGLDSRTILDQNGAEQLLGRGDMLYLASGGARRLHGAYLSDAEVQGMVRVARKRK